MSVLSHWKAWSGSTWKLSSRSCPTTSNISAVRWDRCSSYRARKRYGCIKKRLAQSEKRIGELDRLFFKIFEDNASAKLSDEHFAMMNATYESEQTELETEVKNLQEEAQVQKQQIQNLEVFIQRVKKIHHHQGIHSLRPQRACKGHLCGGFRQVQRQAEAEDTYWV